jgi:hypothetical protein
MTLFMAKLACEICENGFEGFASTATDYAPVVTRI